MRTMLWMGLVGVAVMMACSDDPVTAPRPVPPLATVFSANGRIGATVSQFRATLGAPNGGIAGEQPAGRREINWDGAAAIPFNNRNDFPADFFNTTGRCSPQCLRADWQQPVRPVVPGCRPADAGGGARRRRRVQRPGSG